MDSEKRLLVIGGGKSIHTFNLINLIKDYFSSVMLVTDYKNKDYSYIEQKQINYSLKNPSHIITSTLQIRIIIKQYNPSFIIILQVDTGAFLTLLAKKKNIPSLIIAMGSDILLNPQKGSIHRAMIRFVLRRSKYYNTDAKCVADKMKELIGKNIDVHLANFGFNNNIQVAVKQKIIYSNRLQKPLYRIENIIRSFAIFAHKNPDWTLVVAASGEEEHLNEVIKTLHLEDKVQMVGWLDSQMNNYYYSIATIWVSIPMSDSTPISMIEAMRAECVPIVPDLPAMHEWITDGVNGVIVKDLGGDFFSQVFNLDFQKAIKINRDIAMTYGSKESNQKKFYSIFDMEFNPQSVQ